MFIGIPSLMVSRGIHYFSPMDVSGLKIWLKADALTLNDNDPVTTWTDSSGNGFSPTQSTAGLKPLFKTAILNGFPIVRFDGSDDQLDFSGSALAVFNNVASGTLVVVCSDTNNAGGDTDHTVAGFCTNSTTNARIIAETRLGGVSQFDSRARRLDTDTAVTATKAFVSGFHTIYADNNWTGNSNTVYVDNVAGTSIGYVSGAGNTSATNSGAASVGGRGASATSSFPGDVAEVLAYVPRLSATDRALIQTYVSAKYAI